MEEGGCLESHSGTPEENLPGIMAVTRPQHETCRHTMPTLSHRFPDISGIEGELCDSITYAGGDYVVKVAPLLPCRYRRLL